MTPFLWTNYKLVSDWPSSVLSKSSFISNTHHREWLPIILGPEAMSDFALDVWDPSEYMPNLSPNIFNAFATAAFRLVRVCQEANQKLRIAFENSVLQMYFSSLEFITH